MEKLPNPILSEILMAVGQIYELIQLAVVCKRWKHLIEKAHLYVSYQGTHIRKFQPINVDMWRVIEMCNNKSLSLKILSLDLRNMKFINSDIVQIFASQPRILKLNLTNTYTKLDELWAAIFQLKVNLQSKNPPEEFEFPLEELRVSNNRYGSVGYNTLVKIYPNLKKLYAGNTYTTKEDFKTIVSNFKKLELLDVMNCDSIIKLNEDLNELNTALNESNLRRLFITDIDPEIINFFEGHNIEIVNKYIETVLSEVNDESDLECLEYWLKQGIDIDLTITKIYSKTSWVYPRWKFLKSNKNENLIAKAYQIMIRYGFDLCFHSSETNMSLINAAISTGNVALVDVLLKYKADIWPYKVSCPDEMPAVTYAASSGNILIFQLFLKYNLYPKNFDYEKFCHPVCAALRNRQKVMLEFFMKNNFPYFECNRHNRDWISSLKIVDTMLDNPDYFQLFVIHEAAQHYIIEKKEKIALKIINFLIEKGIVDKEKEILRKNTCKIYDELKQSIVENDCHKPLIVLAAENGCKSVLEKCVESGFDINAEDKFGWTAIFAASSCGNLDFFIYLHNHGGIIDKRDKTGKTALHQAAHNGYVNIIKELIRLGADVSSICNEGYSPLNLAKMNYKHEAALVLKSIDISSKNGDRKSCKLF